MKFIFFSAQYLPTVGGVERYTNSLAKQLIKKGHSAVVVTSALQGLAAEETDESGIKIYRLPVKWFMNRRFPLVIPNSQFKNICKKIKGEKPDFALIQTRFYTNSVFAVGFCKKNNIPAIVVEHGTAYLVRKGIAGFLGKIYEHIAARYIYSKCKNFYGVSANSCKWLSNFNIHTDNILYNAIDIDTIDSIPIADRNIFGINQNAKVVFFSSRMIAEKGIFKLLNAFKNLNLPKEKAVLIAAGSGPMLDEVLKSQCDNIVILGQVPFEKVISICKMSDIFCLPTDYPEGFPTAILEAAACNTFIITTDRGGSKELIRNSDYGIILNNNTEKEIEHALLASLEYNDNTAYCISNCRTLLQQNFTWNIVADKLEQIAKEAQE